MTIKIVISKKEKKHFVKTFSNVEDELLSIVMENTNQISKTLETKKELLLPMLDLQKYFYFYRINSSTSETIFCIMTQADKYNSFFNEIPFLKLHLQNLKKKLDTNSFKLVENSKEITNLDTFDFSTINNSELIAKKDKDELRSIITSALGLLELFQYKTNDSEKTKTINSMKKKYGEEDFQLILDIAKPINNNISDLIIPYTTFEKNYTNSINDL